MFSAPPIGCPVQQPQQLASQVLRSQRGVGKRARLSPTSASRIVTGHTEAVRACRPSCLDWGKQWSRGPFGMSEMATLSNLDTSASVFQPSQLLNWVYLNLSPNDNGNQIQQQTPQQITTAAIQNGNYGNPNNGDLWINPQSNLNHLNVCISFFFFFNFYLFIFLGLRFHLIEKQNCSTFVVAVISGIFQNIWKGYYCNCNWLLFWERPFT